jgi:hypothetical protein
LRAIRRTFPISRIAAKARAQFARTEIDNWRGEQGKQLRHQQTADAGIAQRLVEFGPCPEPEQEGREIPLL